MDALVISKEALSHQMPPWILYALIRTQLNSACKMDALETPKKKATGLHAKMDELWTS